MNFRIAMVLLWIAGCAAKPETPGPTPPTPEVELPAEESAQQATDEACMQACIASMAMQARSAESIRDQCEGQCTNEDPVLGPRELE